MTPQDLGDSGRQCFEIELSRYPGIREGLKSRLAAASIFTFYPTAMLVTDPEQWNGWIYDPRVPLTGIEREHLRHCFDLMTSFVSASDQHYFLVQSDHRRLDRLDPAGQVPTGAGETVMVFSLKGARWDHYEAEVWTYLRGGQVDTDEVVLTINRGMLHPRALGILTFLEKPPSRQSVDQGVAEDIVRNARYIVYDAFDGQWPIFAELPDASLKRGGPADL